MIFTSSTVGISNEKLWLERLWEVRDSDDGDFMDNLTNIYMYVSNKDIIQYG